MKEFLAKIWFSLFKAYRRNGNPLNALKPSRFDIPAKTSFARSILSGNTSSYPQSLYYEHLSIFNGFFEETPRKTSKEEFTSAFHEIIRAHKTESFINKQSPIPMSPSGQIIDGAHRIASAIIQDKDVHFVESPLYQSVPYDFIYFRDKGLSEKSLDSMALEYLRLTPRKTHMVVMYPIIDFTDETASKILREVSDVVYEKTIDISSVGTNNFMHQLYFGESWVDRHNQSSLISKAEASFGTGRTHYQIKVILIETHQPLKAISQAKQRIRKHFDNHHAIHITDTKLESEIVAKMVFNQNSIHLINNQNLYTPTPRFDDLFKAYSSKPANEERCIDSGGVLAAYGLRDVGGDLDYIYRTTGKHPKESPDGISNHLSEVEHFEHSFDEIITNPAKHFYYLGQKFATLEVVAGMKTNRNEPKDRDDVRLIYSIENR